MVENIKLMADFAKENKINLRPHVKTHKCPKIGKLQLKEGASGICVARVGEAEIFVENGFNDILIANQVVEINQIRRLINLNRQSLVRVCVDSKRNILDLNKLSLKEGIKLEVLLEIDVGLGRNGVKPGEAALELGNFIKGKDGLKLVGLQGYEGHLISIKDQELRKKQTEDCMKDLILTRDLLNENGFEIDYITASNSVTCKHSAKVDGITEIQPGTYILNDEHHAQIIPEFNIAATILGTISNIPGKRIHTIDIGMKAATNDNGFPVFKDYSKCKIRIMMEDHSVFISGKQDSFEIGQKIEIIPSHICTTVNLYDFYTVIKKDEVIAKWGILARGKNY
ncbi:MAG: alanine racemase [Candidatus Thorarchaeota archaeon]